MFCYAAAQIQKVADVVHKLGGKNQVFWGGREGYQSLLNTDMKKECDHMATMFKMALDYKKRKGYESQFLLEPKPREPCKHQVSPRKHSLVFFQLTLFELTCYVLLLLYSMITMHKLQWPFCINTDSKRTLN